MLSFTHTPQSPLLKSMISSPKGKTSFSATYLADLEFEPGDLVCGIFRVVCKECNGDDGARIEMALDPDEGFRGPRGEGRVIGRVVERGGDVVFLNDTVMWRKRVGGKPEILESRLGGWLHELMVLWLVDSGVRAVMKG